ncbi:hypothetical protein EVA_08645, partial [gut metagenome]
ECTDMGRSFGSAATEHQTHFGALGLCVGLQRIAEA